jgi:hypothetical protein
MLQTVIHPFHAERSDTGNVEFNLQPVPPAELILLMIASTIFIVQPLASVPSTLISKF